MSTYRAATGTGVALGSLTVLSPQPRSRGLQYTQTVYSASGVVYRSAPFVVLEWSMLESVTEYTTILGVFGLSSADSAAVTVYVRNANFAWVRMSGRAIKPVAEWNGFFIRDVQIVVRDLEVAS